MTCAWGGCVGPFVVESADPADLSEQFDLAAICVGFAVRLRARRRLVRMGCRTWIAGPRSCNRSRVSLGRLRPGFKMRSGE